MLGYEKKAQNTEMIFSTLGIKAITFILLYCCDVSAQFLKMFVYYKKYCTIIDICLIVTIDASIYFTTHFEFCEK